MDLWPCQICALFASCSATSMLWAIVVSSLGSLERAFALRCMASHRGEAMEMIAQPIERGALDHDSAVFAGDKQVLLAFAWFGAALHPWRLVGGALSMVTMETGLAQPAFCSASQTRIKDVGDMTNFEMFVALGKGCRVWHPFRKGTSVQQSLRSLAKGKTPSSHRRSCMVACSACASRPWRRLHGFSLGGFMMAWSLTG